MFGFGIFDVLIIAGALAVQYFFSSRHHVFWGAIIPVIFTGFMIQQFLTDRIGTWLEFVLLLLLGLAFLTAEWGNGRRSLREKQKKELQQMQTQDMN